MLLLSIYRLHGVLFRDLPYKADAKLRFFIGFRKIEAVFFRFFTLYSVEFVILKENYTLLLIIFLCFATGSATMRKVNFQPLNITFLVGSSTVIRNAIIGLTVTIIDKNDI